jgi:hypothetical protein
MATVQQQILESFFEKLSKLGTLEQTTLDGLRKVLQSGKKLKTDDFVTLLSKNPKDSTA